MAIVELSQIIFNIVVSIAVIVISVLISIIAFDIIKFINSAKKAFNNLSEKSNELYQHLDNFFANISALPFISSLFKKRKSKS